MNHDKWTKNEIQKLLSDIDKWYLADDLLNVDVKSIDYVTVKYQKSYPDKTVYYYFANQPSLTRTVFAYLDVYNPIFFFWETSEEPGADEIEFFKDKLREKSDSIVAFYKGKLSKDEIVAKLIEDGIIQTKEEQKPVYTAKPVPAPSPSPTPAPSPAPAPEPVSEPSPVPYPDNDLYGMQPVSEAPLNTGNAFSDFIKNPMFLAILGIGIVLIIITLKK